VSTPRWYGLTTPLKPGKRGLHGHGRCARGQRERAPTVPQKGLRTKIHLAVHRRERLLRNRLTPGDRPETTRSCCRGSLTGSASPGSGLVVHHPGRRCQPTSRYCRRAVVRRPDLPRDRCAAATRSGLGVTRAEAVVVSPLTLPRDVADRCEGMYPRASLHRSLSPDLRSTARRSRQARLRTGPGHASAMRLSRAPSGARPPPPPAAASPGASRRSWAW
jgi:hypothetical protein